MNRRRNKYQIKAYDRGKVPLSNPAMAVLSVEKMLECLKEAGLTKCAALLKSESKEKKVNLEMDYFGGQKLMHSF